MNSGTAAVKAPNTSFLCSINNGNTRELRHATQKLAITALKSYSRHRVESCGEDHNSAACATSVHSLKSLLPVLCLFKDTEESFQNSESVPFTSTKFVFWKTRYKKAIQISDHNILNQMQYSGQTVFFFLQAVILYVTKLLVTHTTILYQQCSQNANC